MKLPQLRLFARFSGRFVGVWTLPLAGSLLAAGCTTPDVWLAPPSRVTVVKETTPAPQIHQVLKPPVEELPPPTVVNHPAEGVKRTLPISLDTVLRLAEEQNVQVGVAREKLYESEIEKKLADVSWLPNLHLGLAYYRHEGGIQNEDGSFTRSSFGSMYPGMDMHAKMDLRETMYQKISAERKIWQQQHELARITSETLLDASSTYIDLLAARTTEAILKRMDTLEQDVLKWAEALFKQEKSAEIQVETIRAQVSYRRQALVQTRLQAEAASAKLAYLLGVGPDCDLEPADDLLQPVELVDAGQPTAVLVARALDAGPGVRELEQMIAVIQRGIDASTSGLGRFMPIMEFNTAESGYGAGPNATMEWGNRWDMGAQMYWNLTDLVKAKDKSALARNQLEQAELGYRDLQGRLTMGVQEAQSTIQGNKRLIDLGNEQVKHADRTYKLGDQRLKQRVEGGSTTEVLSAIRVLEGAHLTVLSAVRAHNKAQVRLMVLMGAAAQGEPHHK